MNKIVKNTLYLYLRQLFTLFLSLYTSRLTLLVLGVTDFGVFAAIGGVTAFLAIVTSSLSNSTQRFLTFSIGKSDLNLLNKTYITSIEIHLVLSFVLFFLAETIGLYFFSVKMVIPEDRVDVAFWVYQLSILTSVVSIITAPHSAELVAHEDMGYFALFMVLESVLKLLSVIILSSLTVDKLLIYSLFVFLLQVLIRGLMVIFCRRNYKECRFIFCLEKKLCKSMISLTSWTFIQNLGVMGFIQGTNILLNMFFGPVINAAYSISFQAYWGVRNFTSSFQLASNPQIVKLYSQNNLEDMKLLVIRVCKFSVYLVFLLSFPIIMNSNVILTIWLKEVPAHTQYFFILLLIFSYIDVMAFPLDVAAQATGKIKKYSIICFCFYLTILFVSYVFYIYGTIPETIIYIAIAISFICIITRVVLLNRLINLSLGEFLRNALFRPFLTILMICPIVLFVKYVVGSLSIWESVVFFIAIFVYGICVVYYGGLEKDEKIVVRGYISNALHKIRHIDSIYK